MSSVNNELRRTKKKLELLSVEGIYGVLGDLLENAGISSNKEKLEEITKLKMQYYTKIKELEKPDLQQQNLFK